MHVTAEPDGDPVHRDGERSTTARVPHSTAIGLEARAEAIITDGGLGHRGVWDSIAEARRQLGWGNDRFAARWIARAEMLAGLITQTEFGTICDALQAAADSGRRRDGQGCPQAGNGKRG
jgi:hypothetical protein